MKIRPKDFIVPAGKPVDLADWPTLIDPAYDSKKAYEKRLSAQVEELGELQELLYASNRHALLLIFQGMDASGKDGAIRHVMSAVDPLGYQAYSFKQPSAEELDHDFLWRTTRCLPERGRIGIFNRSYYEEVLVVRVHPEILQGQSLPQEALAADSLWDGRYRSIVDHERHLHRNGTRIVKFFLHISKDEQRKRFIARIDEPDKNWKFSVGDVAERRLWDEYMAAYAACLGTTSTEEAPWHVVPADDKRNARLIIASIITSALRTLDMRYPAVTAARRKELAAIRKKLG